MYLTTEMMDEMDNEAMWGSTMANPPMHDEWDESLMHDTLRELRE